MRPAVRARHHAVVSLALLTALTSLGGIGDLLGLGGSTDSGSHGSHSAESAPTPEQFRAMGSTDAPNRRLRRGCRNYPYTYVVRPPSGHDDWGLELLLTGPRGGRIASAVFVSGADATSGSSSFRICKSTARAGLFTIRGKLSYTDYPDTHSGWIAEETFRLRRPR